MNNPKTFFSLSVAADHLSGQFIETKKLAEKSLWSTLINSDLERLNELFIYLKQEQVEQVKKLPMERSKLLPQISRSVQIAALALKLNRLRIEEPTPNYSFNERDLCIKHLRIELSMFNVNAQANATRFTPAIQSKTDADTTNVIAWNTARMTVLFKLCKKSLVNSITAEEAKELEEIRLFYNRMAQTFRNRKNEVNFPVISRAVQIASLALNVYDLQEKGVVRSNEDQTKLNRYKKHLCLETDKFGSEFNNFESMFAKNHQTSIRTSSVSSVKENGSFNLQFSQVIQNTSDQVKSVIDKSNVVPSHHQNVVSLTDDEIVKTLGEIATKVVVDSMSTEDITNLQEIITVAKTRHDQIIKSSNPMVKRLELAKYAKMIQVAQVIFKIKFIVKRPDDTDTSKRLLDLESDLKIQFGSLRRDVANKGSVKPSDDPSGSVPTTTNILISSPKNQFIFETVHKLSQFLDNEISELVDFRNEITNLSDCFTRRPSADSIEFASMSRLLLDALVKLNSKISLEKPQQVSLTGSGRIQLNRMPKNGVPEDSNQDTVGTAALELQRAGIVDRSFQLGKNQFSVHLPSYEAAELKADDNTSTIGTPNEIIVLILSIIGLLVMKCLSE